MRFLRPHVLLAMIALASSPAVRPAHAGWDPNGVDVCPACGWKIYREPSVAPDGAGGAYVSTWDGGWNLLIHHILASGTLDPGWPGYGINPSAIFAQNFAAGLSPDGAGRVYVGWAQTGCVAHCSFYDGGLPYLQRFTSIPTISPGWPVGGIEVAEMIMNTPPLIQQDGAGGVVICMQKEAFYDTDNVVRVARFSGSGARVWPAGLQDGLVAPRSPKSEDDPSLAVDGSGRIPRVGGFDRGLGAGHPRSAVQRAAPAPVGSRCGRDAGSSGRSARDHDHARRSGWSLPGLGRWTVGKRRPRAGRLVVSPFARETAGRLRPVHIWSPTELGEPSPYGMSGAQVPIPARNSSIPSRREWMVAASSPRSPRSSRPPPRRAASASNGS